MKENLLSIYLDLLRDILLQTIDALDPNDLEYGTMPMDPKIKVATFIFFDEQILMECPFCGRTLIKTDYSKIKKLLNEESTPRGKICEKCGGVSVLRLNAEARNIIMTKLGETLASIPEAEAPKDQEQG
ncbi:hypothetical protein [Desulfomonile tiedjei]|uniref:hypothetical protein n=1 Tax=Desulfomonile tiedjei TaxID=2358 RepID=UPI0012F75535|nr:hypothetical protein [Desulfomonile tiedjei]